MYQNKSIIFPFLPHLLIDNLLFADSIQVKYETPNIRKKHKKWLDEYFFPFYYINGTKENKRKNSQNLGILFGGNFRVRVYFQLLGSSGYYISLDLC